MDFQLTYDKRTGTIDQTFAKGADILNNIIISLAIKKGTWWNDPAFGLTDRPRLKNTPATARLIKQDIEQALQWIIDAGRATAIRVETWRDANDRHRLNVLVTATQADGRIITYTTFKEVV
ncbi:phage GP46 family protein [Geobacter argillaceus]|uniref:Phage gp46-like protein n=1 Tax=Geobacter argillaceus TaxID=345631 RepID=A0A562V032_9BACT|nr:phage GP46 family protein [Geobacter argillaceus]TWJ11167.1 phage gp46-like protein [Geobacter argillaceus]